MLKKKAISNQNIFIFFSLYISLLIGFYFGENLNFGSKNDWFGANINPIKDFSSDFTNTFLNYEMYNHRHSPVYLIFLSLFHKIGLSFELIRFAHLNLSLILIYAFFKCLKLKFKKIDPNILFLISISIMLSPTFRSLAIWPDTRIIGLILFTLSILEFLKFEESKKNIHFYKNLLLIISSSYISPNFSIFIIFFYYIFFYKLNFNLRNFSYGILICFFLALPMFYYLFILDVNFLLAKTPGVDESISKSLSLNLSNKILIISSIIFFHILPFIININFLNKLKIFLRKNFFLILIFLFINTVFFNYSLNFTGGGIFFQLSNYLLGNNLIFYIFCFISLSVLTYFISCSFTNLIIISILIVSNIQNTIYHKYFDPLILIIFFTIFNTSLVEEFFKKKNNLIYLYIFYLGYILLRYAKNTFFLI